MITHATHASHPRQYHRQVVDFKQTHATHAADPSYARATHPRPFSAHTLSYTRVSGVGGVGTFVINGLAVVMPWVTGVGGVGKQKQGENLSQKPLREAMPTVAAWIDQLRDAFGADTVNAAIRNGVAGGNHFYARENGHEIGCEIGCEAMPGSHVVSASDMVLAKPEGGDL